MTNINKMVWEYIDQRMEIKKNLLEGLINISALARKIADENDLKKNIDAIISAIRRYEGQLDIKYSHSKLYKLLKECKVTTRTKLASLLIKRNSETEKIVSKLYLDIPSGSDNVMRSIELTNFIKLIFDKKYLQPIKKKFFDRDLKRVEKDLAEIYVAFGEDLSMVPGIYATVSHELALNNISMVYAMGSNWEQILIIQEKDLAKAFTCLLKLTSSV